MTRQERKDAVRDHFRSFDQARAVAADAMGLSYGPSECSSADAEDLLETRSLESYSRIIPVQYVLTSNRGILEILAR